MGTREGVQVWRVDLGQGAEWIEAGAARWLDPDERARADRGSREVRRRRLAGAVALRLALSHSLGQPPESLTILRDSAGKPVLAGPEAGSLHFNVSRSGDCCLIALTRTGPVGIDVERLAPIPELGEIVRSRFAAEEAGAILRLTGDRRLRAFYNCWTRKEAYLKARGTGILDSLDGVEVTVDDDRPLILSLEDGDPAAWTLLNVHVGPGIVGAVALEAAGPVHEGAIDAEVLPLELHTDAALRERLAA